MIGDMERSEVAKSLRRVAKAAKIREKKTRPDLVAAWMALSTAIKGRIAFCDTSDVFDALADLIEPSFHCDEILVKDFAEDKTNIVRKAYVVSVSDCDGDYKIPMWMYPTREAAEKKAREYTKRKRNDVFRRAIVNEVKVMDE